jgi:amino acid transporter
MYVLNEVKDPVRTIKIAGPLGLSTCGILYILANIAYFSAATPKEIAASGTTVASFFMGKVFGTSAQRALRLARTHYPRILQLHNLANYFSVFL